MQEVMLTKLQTARLFPKASDAKAYADSYMPDSAQAEVCLVLAFGLGSAYGILLLKSINAKEKTLFELKNLEHANF